MPSRGALAGDVANPAAPHRIGTIPAAANVPSPDEGSSAQWDFGGPRDHQAAVTVSSWLSVGWEGRRAKAQLRMRDVLTDLLTKRV
jgi:hypothetical protein